MAGYDHACVIRRSDSRVVCWGQDAQGQSSVPGTLGAVSRVAVGRYNTCAIRSADSHVECWGANGSGQAAVPANLGAVRDVTVGDEHVCAIAANYTTRCWGGTASGEAVVPADLQKATQISAGAHHTCILTKSTGLVRCWGTLSGTYQFTRKASTVVSGGDAFCAITYPTRVLACSRNPRPGDGAAARTVTVADDHACILLKSAGALRCSGANDLGQSNNLPPTLKTFASTIIAAGHGYTCASGTGRISAKEQTTGVVCWGANDQGQATVPAEFRAPKT